MIVSTTAPAVIELPRRRLVGLIIVIAALAATLTWTITAVVAIDSASTDSNTMVTRQNVPAVDAAATAVVGTLVDADDQPIVVADAYHGVGFLVCRGDADPIAVADANHGVGVSVCV